MKDIKKYFTASLFPYSKGDFDSVEFEKRCLTSSFCDCILYATQKSLDEANDSPELDVRTKTSFIHSRFYRNVAIFLPPLILEILPRTRHKCIIAPLEMRGTIYFTMAMCLFLIYKVRQKTKRTFTRSFKNNNRNIISSQ